MANHYSTLKNHPLGMLFLLSCLLLAPLSAWAAGEKPSVRSLDKTLVSKFVFEDNTVFSDAELSRVVASFTGREITFEELEQARRRLSEFYINHGYVNSGALIPDQQIAGGEVRIRIVEGRLSRISVTGNKWLRTRYVVSRLERGEGGDQPLDYTRVQNKLRLLKEDPIIENIHARLSPGLAPGEAELDLEVKEARPYQVSLIADNHRSPSVGSYRGIVRFSHVNLTGWGDSLLLQYGLTEGTNEYLGRYAIPVNRWDTRVGLSAEQYASDIVTQPFDLLDITSETTRFGAFVAQPVFRSSRRELNLELELQRSKNTVKLGGAPFPFSPYEGDERGVYRTAPLRFHQQYIDRGLKHVAALRSTFSFGLDILDATIDVDPALFGNEAPNARFFSWLGQFQFIWRLEQVWESQLFFRINSQLTPDRLLPSELYGLGGYATVRGYREYVMTTDSGANASVEWQVPLWREPVMIWDRKPKVLSFSLVPFFDWGTGWNNGNLPNPDPGSIYSVGLGLTAAWEGRASAQLFWGHALRDLPRKPDYDIQDDGIHFSVAVNLF